MSNKKSVEEDQFAEEIPPLPSIDDFKLHNILNNIEDSRQIKQQLVDSILQINANYVQDLDDQWDSMIEIENDEILKRFDNVQSLHAKVHKHLGANYEELKNKIKVFKAVNSNITEVNQTLKGSKDRIDGLINILKKIEHKMTLKDQLFNVKSPHEEHYQELYKYGLKDELMKERSKKKSLSSSLPFPISGKSSAAIPIPKAPSSSFDKPPSLNDSTGTRSLSRSPIKMQQYMNLESEIDELKRIRSESISKVRNPTNLIVSETPTCRLSKEMVTIREDRRESRSSPDGVDLVTDLRRLMSRPTVGSFGSGDSSE